MRPITSRRKGPTITNTNPTRLDETEKDTMQTVYPNTFDYSTTSTTTFDIKEANPAFMEDWLHLAIRHYTEKEVADILQHGWAINNCETKAEKLGVAKAVASRITPWLWTRPYPYARGAQALARKLESLQGLMSIIVLAGVR